MVNRGAAGESAQKSHEVLLSLDDLTSRVAMSVRTVRFYASRGLVPPAVRQGRSAYYTADHVARLELVQELQGHGFTLTAIQRYLAGIPADASPADIALRRTMLAPWQADRPVRLTRAQLAERARRPLSETDLATLEAMHVARRVRAEDEPEGSHGEPPGEQGEETWEVAVAQLSVGLGLLEVGYPLAAARAAAAVYAEHGRKIAQELHDVFRSEVWPALQESGASPEAVQDVVERLKPLSISALVHAYEAGMDETKRVNIAERAGPAPLPEPTKTREGEAGAPLSS